MKPGFGWRKVTTEGAEKERRNRGGQRLGDEKGSKTEVREAEGGGRPGDFPTKPINKKVGKVGGVIYMRVYMYTYIYIYKVRRERCGRKDERTTTTL